MSQLARIKENVDWRNENIQEETYATHLAFDSIEQIIESEETELNDCILDNITADEKFKIICRARKIDIDEMASTIWKIIDNSDLEEKNTYATTCQYEDEYGDIYPTYSLGIYYDLLDTKEDWIKTHIDEYEDLSYEECEQMEWYFYVIGDEFTEEQREFIQLALDCGVSNIVIKWMP